MASRTKVILFITGLVILTLVVGVLKKNDSGEISDLDSEKNAGYDYRTTSPIETSSSGPIKCGNGKVDSGENCSSCPQDVGCASDEQCSQGSCVQKAAEYEMKVYLFTPISTGVLYYDQDFYPSYTQRDWAKATILRKGNVLMKNGKLRVSFGDWAESINESLGDIDSETVYINPKLNSHALVSRETNKNVDFTLEYYDSAGRRYTNTITRSVVLLPPQEVTMRETAFSALWSEQRYAPFLQFYDSRISSLAQDLVEGVGSSNEVRAKAIYDGLALRGLKYESDPNKTHQSTYYTSDGEKTITEEFEYIKFPYQTYIEEDGDCEDMAILMACLLQSLNINSFLILWDKPEGIGHSFLSFEGDSGNSVKIESTLIGESSYEQAVARGAEEWQEAFSGWWSSIVVRKAFDDPGVMKLPAMPF